MEVGETMAQDNDGIPTEYDQWRKAMEEHPILGNEYRNMRKMYVDFCANTVRAGKEAEWFSRTYQRVYGPSRYGLEVLFRRFGQLKTQLVMEEFALGATLLLPVWSKLEQNSEAKDTDPVELLKLAFARHGHEGMQMRGEVEAITQYILVRLMLSVDETESEVDAGKTMGFALKWLLNAFFVPDVSDKLSCVAQLDEKRKPVSIQTSTQGDHRLLSGNYENVFPCRLIRSCGRPLWTILNDRIKTDFMSVLKMIRKWRLMCEEYDKHGVTFIVEHESDIDDLAEEILSGLRLRGCEIVESVLDQSSGGVVDPNNPDTDPDFRARRIVFRIPANGHGMVTVELNIQSLSDKLIATISHSPANHDWYTIRRYRKTHFPWRYPQFVYGVDWSDDSPDWQRIGAYVRNRQEWKQ